MCQEVSSHMKPGIKARVHIPDSKIPLGKKSMGKEHQFLNGMILICTNPMEKKFFFFFFFFSFDTLLLKCISS